MQAGGRFEGYVRSKARLYKADDIRRLWKRVRRHASGTDLRPLSFHSDNFHELGKLLVHPDLEIGINIRRNGIHRIFDLRCTVSFYLQRVDDRTRCILCIEALNASHRIGKILARESTQTPDVIRIAGYEITRTLDKLVQLRDRENKTPEHPVVITVAIGSIIKHRLRHGKARRRKQAGVIDRPRKEGLD